jgi:hypothetical protein
MQMMNPMSGEFVFLACSRAALHEPKPRLGLLSRKSYCSLDAAILQGQTHL